MYIIVQYNLQIYKYICICVAHVREVTRSSDLQVRSAVTSLLLISDSALILESSALASISACIGIDFALQFAAFTHAICHFAPVKESHSVSVCELENRTRLLRLDLAGSTWCSFGKIFSRRTTSEPLKP